MDFFLSDPRRILYVWLGLAGLVLFTLMGADKSCARKGLRASRSGGFSCWPFWAARWEAGWVCTFSGTRQGTCGLCSAFP